MVRHEQTVDFYISGMGRTIGFKLGGWVGSGTAPNGVQRILGAGQLLRERTCASLYCRYDGNGCPNWPESRLGK